MARYGMKSKAEEPGDDEDLTGSDDESAIREPRPEPGMELASSYRDEGGMIVPEVRMIYATPPPPSAPPLAVLCTGCRNPIPTGEALLDRQQRPWCSNECHQDWKDAV